MSFYEDKQQEYASLKAAEKPLSSDEWMAALHRVWRDGEIIGDTRIHPGAASLIRRHNMSVYENWSATEPRWEAQTATGIGFGGDPNEAVVDCMTRSGR